MSELLVSVRSVEEAQLVLDREIPFLDVKEPSLGSLGRATDAALEQVARLAEGVPHVTVTAALGELAEVDPRSWRATPGVRLYKLGLASTANMKWREQLRGWKERIETATDASLVAVAYADHHLAEAPPPEAVLEVAVAHDFSFFLIDTFSKSAGTLFTWMSPERLSKLIGQAQQSGLRVAIAGSLAFEDIGRVVEAGADVVAVRGAACVGRQRSGAVDPQRLDALLHALAFDRDLQSD